MQKNNAASAESWTLQYEGPGDQGRIKMTIASSGVCSVRYEKHPMVLSQQQPWEKKVEFASARVEKLFSLLQGQDFLQEKSYSEPLMPGMDVALKQLTLRSGQQPPKKKLLLVDTPDSVKPILQELESLYEEVRAVQN